MKMTEAIACNIISVVELRDAFNGDETVECACHGMYYLVTETCKEFGITRKDVVNCMVESFSYPYEAAVLTVDRYELWAQKITIKESKKNTDNC